MKVILYSTGCPKCNVLNAKLNNKNIEFEIINDMDIMLEKGFMQAPMLEVDEKVMDFSAAIKWINEME
jgi:glutaredoxin